MSGVRELNLPVLGGALCLDFVNTVDPRNREPREEFIGSYRQLLDWGEFIGILSPRESADALAAGTSNEAAAKDVHARALALREALYELFAAPGGGATGALATVTDEWRIAMAHAQLERTDAGFEWGHLGEDALDRVLWPVAESAGALLSSPELDRVYECHGEGCGWLFLDTSKGQRRRWCSMAICGNRAKARRHRRRTARGDAESGPSSR